MEMKDIDITLWLLMRYIIASKWMINAAREYDE